MNRQEYEEAILRVRRADVAYYVDDTPVMSDEEYDGLMRALAAYEKEHPQDVDPDSPTQRVGGKVSGAFATMKHPRRMLSLANVFNLEELEAVDKSMAAELGEHATWLVEPKLDGLTLVVRYEHGRLTQAVTRGDGEQGEDVLATARTIRNLPLRLVADHLSFYARGEVMMTKAVFNELNGQLAAAGKPPFANPRNAAAGSLRQKDPAEAYRRRLTVCFYDVIGAPYELVTERDKLEFLDAAGLPSLSSASTPAENVAEAFGVCQAMANRREGLEYDIDGMVLKVSSVRMQRKLGEGSKTPNWAVAYKFPAEHVATTLKDVQWQVGRTGAVTPVAVFDPVVIGGSKVDHASLHNVDYIKALDLCIGDRISVYKAAEIIPQVATVLERTGGVPVAAPTHCPACGHELHRDGAALVCGNRGCEAGRCRWLEFFAAREHMDIKGLGEAVAGQLVHAGLCRLPSDVYALTKEHLMRLDGFSDRRADALLAEIRKSKDKPADRVLAAIGVDMLGDTLSTDVLREFRSIQAISEATVEALSRLHGVAETTAKAMLASLRDPDIQDCIRGLECAGLHMALEASACPQTLEGLSFCITGTLSEDRETVKKRILEHGGRFQSSVSSKTSYLVAGEGGGEKRHKAEVLQVPVISESELEVLIDGGRQ